MPVGFLTYMTSVGSVGTGAFSCISTSDTSKWRVLTGMGFFKLLSLLVILLERDRRCLRLSNFSSSLFVFNLSILNFDCLGPYILGSDD